MLCGTFCAFCACAVQSPSIRSATEAKRDRVFTGDFMVHVSYVAINGATTECTPSCTCPLWVKSRHHGVSNQCPLYPQKRTLRQRKQMSALCQKQTFRAAVKNVVIRWNLKTAKALGLSVPQSLPGLSGATGSRSFFRR